MYSSNPLWESNSATKGAAKRVKNLLKQNQTNIFLWILYADSQFQKSNVTIKYLIQVLITHLKIRALMSLKKFTPTS